MFSLGAFATDIISLAGLIKPVILAPVFSPWRRRCAFLRIPCWR